MSVKIYGNAKEARHFNARKAISAGLLISLMVPPGVNAARMQSLSWATTSGQPTFTVNFDDTPAFSSERSDDGRRLRLSFPGADLAAQVNDLRGNQYVKGVFPYASDDGREVYVDILLKQQGKLDISASGNQSDALPV